MRLFDYHPTEQSKRVSRRQKERERCAARKIWVQALKLATQSERLAIATVVRKAP
jgi:hypothetical protein